MAWSSMQVVGTLGVATGALIAATKFLNAARKFVESFFPTVRVLGREKMPSF